MKWITDNLRLLIGIGALVIVILVGLQVRSCTQARQKAAQSRVDRGQAEAGIEAGSLAGNTLGNVMTSDQQTDQTVKGARDEILSQPAGNSNAAAIRAACRLRSHCGDGRCAELSKADPAIAACRRSIGATP